MIDIIIPAYNSHKTIERTLYSISYQVIKDYINVYIVNDSSDKDYQTMVSFFSNFISIKELKLKKNSGPGVARQYGIDNSNSKYIIFIDSDDVFYDCFSIKRLYDEIEKKNCDVVIGNFIEEVQNRFINHERDSIWLHGKIYSRKYLINNNIRFNESRLNEDNGFNQLIFLGNSKIEYLNYNIYIWCNNENSITRKNNHSVLYDLLLGYIYNITWALKNAILRDYDHNKIAELSLASLIAIYSHYLKFETENNSEDILRNSKDIKEISDKYIISDERKYFIMENQYSSIINSGGRESILNPSITFNEFLLLIDKENYDRYNNTSV